MFGRQKVAALVAEFLGTFVLATAVLETIYGGAGLSLLIALAAGLVMVFMVLLMGSFSGAHLNPVVTIGLWTIRKIQTTQALVYIAAQMLGGIAAWQFGEFLLDRPLRNIAGDGFSVSILVAEAVGAMIFTMAVAAAVSRAYTGGKLAATAGLGLMFGMLVASVSANGVINPTGVINPALAVGIQSWSWSYLLGPLAGAIIGMNLYNLVFGPLDNPKPRTVKAVVSSVAKKAKTKAKKATKRTTRKKK